MSGSAQKCLLCGKYVFVYEDVDSMPLVDNPKLLGYAHSACKEREEKTKIPDFEETVPEKSHNDLE